MRRGAPSRPVEDLTDLDGPRIDVARRLGWTLRMARLLAPSAPTLRTMSDQVGVSVSTLHRLETGAFRSGVMVDAYERALARPTASLRAPLDILSRGFPYGPADRDPGVLVPSVREQSRLTEVVGRPGCRGSDWLAWARPLAEPGAIGLPVGLAVELVDRLVGELGRAAGPAFHPRYEALSLLRCGPYGDVVLEVARERVADPHVQVFFDLMSAIGERSTPDAVAWCLGLLDDERGRVVQGAVLALENMAAVSDDPDFWCPLVGRLVDAFDRTELGSTAWVWQSHLLRLVPAPLLRRLGVHPRHHLAPRPETPGSTAEQERVWFDDATARAEAVTGALGLRREPMLARLVHEIVYSPFEARGVTAGMLLSAVPPLVAEVAEQVCAVAEHHDDPVIRGNAGRRASNLVHGPLPASAERWLGGPDLELSDVALRLAAAAGAAIPEGVLRAALDRGQTAHALYAAGMTGDPWIDRLADDPEAPPEVRGAARWWRAAGTRLVETPAPRPPDAVDYLR